MPVDYDSPLALTLNNEFGGPAPETGDGRRLPPSQWGGADVARTLDNRAMFLAYLQGQPGSDWFTNTAAPNDRRRLGAHYAATGTVREFQWGEVPGDWWLRLEPGATLTSAGVWTGGGGGLLRANSWWVLKFWPYGAHGTTEWVATVEWGGETGGVPNFRLRIAGDGYAALSKDGIEVARGPLSRNAVAGRSLISVCAKPLCRRALYLYGDHAELRYEDAGRDPLVDHCDPDAADPLVPAGTWKVTAHKRLELQLSECVFPASGVVRAPVKLGKAPGAGVVFSRPDGSSLIWRDVPSATTVALSTPGFVPETDEEVTIEAQLSTADRRVTPVFYGTGFRFATGPAGSRTDESDPWLAHVLAGATLDVSEDRSTLRFTLKDAADWRGRLNRAVRLDCGTAEDHVEVFKGTVSDVEWDSDTEMDGTDMVELGAEDEWLRLDKVLIPSFWDFGGMKATDAARALLAYVGYDETRIDIGESDFRLPSRTMNAAGEDGEVETEAAVDPSGGGQTVSGMLRELGETYSDWPMAFIPDTLGDGRMRFVWKGLTALGEGDKPVFYRTHAAALAAGADLRHCVRRYRCRTLPPEANEIHVFGEAEGGAVIHAQWPAANAPNPSADPTLDEAERPANWVGDRWLMEVYSADVNTPDIARWVLYCYVERCGYARREIEFDAEWNPKVRLFSTVTIDGDGDYQITGYSFAIEREAEIGSEGGPVACRRWRPATYRAERRLA